MYIVMSCAYDIFRSVYRHSTTTMLHIQTYGEHALKCGDALSPSLCEVPLALQYLFYLVLDGDKHCSLNLVQETAASNPLIGVNRTCFVMGMGSMPINCMQPLHVYVCAKNQCPPQYKNCYAF